MIISGTTVLLYLLSCFFATFVAIRSPLTDFPRSVATRVANRLGAWVGGKVEYLLSCWMCSGAWASLLVFLMEYPLVHSSLEEGVRASVAEAFMFSASGAVFTYCVGKATDFLDEFLESKKIEFLSAADFEAAKSGVESTSGEPPNK